MTERANAERGRMGSKLRVLFATILFLGVLTDRGYGQQPDASLSCGSVAGQAGDILLSFDGALDRGVPAPHLTFLIVGESPPSPPGHATLGSVTSGIRAECRSQRALYFRLSGLWRSDTLRLVAPPGTMIQIHATHDTARIATTAEPDEVNPRCQIRFSSSSDRLRVECEP